MRVVFAPQAYADLESTIDFIRPRDWAAAAHLAERVLDVIDRIAERQFEGPVVVLASGERVRSWPVPPLRVYYQRTDDALRVLRIYHQARRPLVR